RGQAISKEHYASEFRGPGVEPAPERTERLIAYFEKADAGPWAKPAPGPDRPDIKGHAFLLGFARSGTTLLENVMASRDDVVAIEERPVLADAEDFLESTEGLDRLAVLGEEEARRYRALYWGRVTTELPDTEGKFVLDKYPMLTPSLPLIAKLFP